MPEYGNWKEVRQIGQGSFGTVYEIEQVDEFGFSTKSALKVIRIPQSDMQIEELRCEGESEERVAEYFREMTAKVMDEVRLMYNLKGHTNIVGYLDHEIRLLDDGISREILIRMELLTPLRQYTLNHKITRRDVIKLGIDICHALERCQQFNIIHRDIKPGNILVTEQGDYKLSDFGIARKVSEDGTMASMSQKGTYSYMAPEVYLGRQYGYSVDLYSLGIVMYQLLNYNRDPFLPVYPNPIHHGDRKKSHLLRMKGEPLPLPAQDNSRLAEIILKACSYDAKDRYSSPKQMSEDLESILYSDQDLDRFLDEKDNDIEIPSSEISVTASSEKFSSDIIEKKENLTTDSTHYLWEKEEEIKEEEIKEEDITIESDDSAENPEKEEVLSEENENPVTKEKPAWIKAFAGIAVVVLVIVGIFTGQYLSRTTKVPNVTNMTEAEAKKVLEEASLIVSSVNQTNSEQVAVGKVIEASHQGKRLDKNSKVTVTVSLGRRIVIPDVKGQEETKVRKELTDAGLVVKIETAYSIDVTKGQVMAQSLSPDESVNEGQEILLTISLGPKPVVIEDYTEKKESKVKKTLEEEGVIVKEDKQFSDTVKKDAVIKQSVKAGETIYAGQTIILTVSKGKEQVKVPDVTGLTKEKAASKLKEAGLKLGSITNVYSSSSYGKITSQSLDAGDMVDKGSSVNVNISIGERKTTTSSSSSGRSSSSSKSSTKKSSKSDDSIDIGEMDVIN